MWTISWKRKRKRRKSQTIKLKKKNSKRKKGTNKILFITKKVKLIVANHVEEKLRQKINFSQFIH